MIPGAVANKPAFLKELAAVGEQLYAATTPDQRAQFITSVLDFLAGRPSKLENFARIESETIAIKAAGK